MTFDAHRDLDSMTEADKSIEKLLEQQIPSILNKIQSSSDEVYEELDPILANLNELLLSNQQVYPQQSIDKELGKYIAFLTAVMYAQGKGLLLGKATEILNMEMQSALAQ